MKRIQGCRSAYTKTVLALVVALSCAGAAHAESSSGHHGGFSYDYAEFRYFSATVEEGGSDVDGTGLEFAGSAGIGDRYLAYALYKDIGLDHDIDISEWAVGFGAYMPLAPSTDIVAQLGYISEQLKVPGHATFSDTGYQLGIGLRQKVAERGEILLRVNLTEFSETGSLVSYELAGEMHVMPTVAIGLGINTSTKATSYFAEARVYFGTH